MEQKFKTLIKSDTRLGVNKYVQGRISGYQDYICHRNNNKLGLSNKRTEAGLVIGTVCTAEEYEEFKNFTESRYPGVCVFDYKENGKEP